VFAVGGSVAHLGLYMILPIPIVYGVWYATEGVGGAYIAQSSCNSNATV